MCAVWWVWWCRRRGPRLLVRPGLVSCLDSNRQGLARLGWLGLGATATATVGGQLIFGEDASSSSSLLRLGVQCSTPHPLVYLIAPDQGGANCKRAP